MSASIPIASQVAAEAEFQLSTAKDFALWMEALSRAIKNAVTHDGGLHVNRLADIANYLACDAVPGIEDAISKFASIVEAESAPQKMQSENVARDSAEDQP